MFFNLAKLPRSVRASGIRLSFNILVICFAVSRQMPGRQLPALPDATKNNESLAGYLAANAVARARGHGGNPDDLRILDHWGYAHYSGTNLALLTNAVWSTNCWLHGVQGLSATPIGYSNGMGGQTLLTMVSARHYLFASHVHPEGDLVIFLDTNNVLYWRRTLQRVDVGNDTSVGILNADLPPSVGYLPVAPENFRDYLSTNNPGIIQGIGMNQDMRVFSQPLSFNNPVYVVWTSTARIPSGLGTNWSVALRGGDSSDPEMILIRNQLVLVSHAYSVNLGPDYALQTKIINQKMHYLSTNNQVGTDYQLTQYPLTNWPTNH